MAFRLTESHSSFAELWSYLPYEGRATLTAHRAIGRVARRLPDGADPTTAKGVRSLGERSWTSGAIFGGTCALVENVAVGEQIDLRINLKEYETTERAAGADYRVRWKGSAVTRLEPPGPRVPLYRGRADL